jgi:hypothetical protein
VTIGGLGVVFIIVMLYLISQKSLLPGIVILGSFILFVLWMVGLIATSIELWGPQGNVNASCNMYVTNMEYHGQSLETLAWLQQNNICEYLFPGAKRGVGRWAGANDINRSKLESRICFPTHRHGVSAVDDDHELSGLQG